MQRETKSQLSKGNVSRFNENFKQAQHENLAQSQKSVFSLKSGNLEKRNDIASKRGSEIGSKRHSIFSRQSQIQKRMELEKALLEKQKQIDDENINIAAEPEAT